MYFQSILHDLEHESTQEYFEENYIDRFTTIK